jgi:hypothetical protein
VHNADPLKIFSVMQHSIQSISFPATAVFGVQGIVNMKAALCKP